jgi:uncharacterized membrane protein YfcA
MPTPPDINLSAQSLFWLWLCGATGGFVDSIAGGGGLITLPALLATGLPPQLALGTNKAQSAVGTALAATRYVRGGLISWRQIWPGVLTSFGASILGTLTVSLVDDALLRRSVPWLLMAVAIHVMRSPNLGSQPTLPRLGPGGFGFFFGCGLGFYDGFLGPGTGAFWTLATVSLLGLELRGATAYTKSVNLASNLGSLCIFLPKGSVLFPAAAVMVCGQVVGAYLGSGLVLERGARLIRGTFLCVVLCIVVRLLTSG